MTTAELQQQFFKAVKIKIDQNLQATDEIATLLNISPDSVYRRMRGEVSLTFDELHLLCTHYHISIDQLMNVQTGAIMFQGNFMDNKNFRFDAYLKSVMNNLAYINSFKEKEYYYLCKDSPFFHHFYFREFAARSEERRVGKECA